MSGYFYNPSVYVEFCRMMKRCTPEEKAAFIARSKSLPYNEFLKTPYWAMIRGVVLADGHNRCHFCGSIFSLNVHHRTYDHRGQEWEFLGDLELLCKDCHEAKHKLASDEQLEKSRRRRLNAWRFGYEVEG